MSKTLIVKETKTGRVLDPAEYYARGRAHAAYLLDHWKNYDYQSQIEAMNDLAKKACAWRENPHRPIRTEHLEHYRAYMSGVLSRCD